MSSLSYTKISDLIDRYDTLLFDSYGVLVNREKALPHAKELIASLNKKHKKFLILTNNASEVKSKICARMVSFGFNVKPEQIISSGCLLKPWVEENNLHGARCLFMGDERSYPLLDGTDCEIIKLDTFKPNSKTNVDFVVVCSQGDSNYRSNIEKLISYIFICIEKNCIPKILMPNPDLIYPRKEGQFGIVSGMVAIMLKEAIKLRFPSFKTLPLYPLGKPSPYIFSKAAEYFSGNKVLMIGDQMETDIRGAQAAGLDSALVSGGVVDASFLLKDYDFSPDYLLKDLSF